MGASLGLSDLYQPFPSRKSPFTDDAIAASRGSAERRGLLSSASSRRRFEAFAPLAGAFFPDASPERLTACTYFVHWLFFVDDLCDGEEHSQDLGALHCMLEEQVRVLRTGLAPRRASGLTAFTASVSRRIAPLFGAARHGAFCDVVEEYLLDGVLMATVDRAARTVPELEPYAQRREADGASHTVIALVELARDITLPDSLRDDVDVARIRRVCARILSFVNDLVSYEKELREGSQNNLLCVLQTQHGMTFPDAVAAAVTLINELTREHQGLGLALSARDPVLRAWVRGLEDLIAGNAQWSFDTRRYASATSPFPELRHPMESGEVVIMPDPGRAPQELRERSR
ncbi:MAG: hypothetical protein K1X94_24485 [Sandaracinaceae bacterium]|nr:hypothetical protein [Sandaracinaceae bacterium]